MSWQVQEAKQRFSEVLRAVESDGPQAITRHGEKVAVVIDIAEYRRLTGGNHDFAAHLMAFPTIETMPGDADVFDEIAAERERDQHS
ncbi:type II toxin-antitoxin system Phd/YefM family antitoxin [Kribbella catacumbae]|uniref:type II toxin-antitoxin system Phd/YefM family antitoxin n=1 Tax=Kribbella catacumbae TaxID=460086 RepID=UPI00037E3F4A|nr:type II toxin-antitoxin system Phd/YefM family antitoxin [Kribbella catacumbae]